MSVHAFCLVIEVPKQTHELEAISQTLLEPLGIALSTSAFRQQHTHLGSRLVRKRAMTVLTGAGILKNSVVINQLSWSDTQDMGYCASPNDGRCWGL